MLIELIVRLCSPTLAGIKSGNLFSIQSPNKNELVNEVADINQLLNRKDIYVEVLKLTTDMALIYIYRKKMLSRRLEQKDIQHFLFKNGYHQYDLMNCFDVLKNHLLEKDFPHEIGVFLDYPLQDVEAFIEYKGKDCLYIGHWKVYNNLIYAKKMFKKYDLCTRNLYHRYLKGFEITQLVAAV